MNTWYAHRYLNWVAFSWNPQRPHQLYHTCTMSLEKMLNWSFANELSLFEWTRDEFEHYADFIAKPDESWCTSSRQPRFIPDAQRDFRAWAINPAWLPFDESRITGSENEIEENIWKREIRIVSQFLNFYLQDVGASRLNVANAPLAHLVFKQPETRETITDAEMTWILRNLKRLLSSHDFQAIEMGLIIARYSSQPLGRVIGSATSPGRLDQFIIDESGRWFERKTGAVGWKKMPRKFDQVFNRYLQYLNIDKRCLLPPSPIFPTDNSKGAIGLKGLRKILVRAREALGNLASASNSPAIRQASHKFRGLTVALVRAPELTVDNGEEGRK
ncbi:MULTISPECIES: integrase [Pseudomonas]|uniref:integrase n=1 Tax=Pseudomonas TaxID=286 RepID=UPI002248EE35|nr:integrase [Pseudomonas sp. DCB_BG]MCX2708223.1 integrase [Pseudomonas sp. DCB_BG]